MFGDITQLNNKGSIVNKSEKNDLISPPKKPKFKTNINVIKQKFKTGYRVKIADEMPASMFHFESGIEAIVKYSYYQEYGGGEQAAKEYSLLLLDKKGKPYNSVSWYDEYQLTLLSKDVNKGLKLIDEYEKSMEGRIR